MDTDTATDTENLDTDYNSENLDTTHPETFSQQTASVLSICGLSQRLLLNTRRLYLHLQREGWLDRGS